MVDILCDFSDKRILFEHWGSAYTKARFQGCGGGFPTRLAVNKHPAGCLFNMENLALRENSSPSSCVSPAAVAVANCLIRFVCAERGVGYKVDISKTKSGYKVDTIVSNL